MDFEATMQLVQVVLSDHCQVAVHRRFPLVTVSYGTPSVQFKIAFNLL